MYLELGRVTRPNLGLATRFVFPLGLVLSSYIKDGDRRVLQL